MSSMMVTVQIPSRPSVVGLFLVIPPVTPAPVAVFLTVKVTVIVILFAVSSMTASASTLIIAVIILLVIILARVALTAALCHHVSFRILGFRGKSRLPLSTCVAAA